MALATNPIVAELVFLIGLLVVAAAIECSGLAAALRKIYWTRRARRAAQALAAAEERLSAARDHLASSKAAQAEFDLSYNPLHEHSDGHDA